MVLTDAALAAIFAERCLDSGPSSNTQSFKSMREVFSPNFGGEGDGDFLFCLRVTYGTDGCMIEYEATVGDSGSSMRLD